MNRPNWKSNEYEVIGADWNMKAYFEDLEKYCDELEKENMKLLSECTKLTGDHIAVAKYKKANKKLCKKLADYSERFDFAIGNDYIPAKSWEEWSFKNG